MSATPSAQYRLTIRVKLDDSGGILGRVTTIIGEAGGMVDSVDLVETDDGYSVRDIVVDASGREHWDRILAAIDTIDGADGHRHDRPHLPAARRRQDRTSQQAPAEDARRPLDGLHAGRRARLPGDRRRRRTRPSSTRSSATRVAVVSDGTAVLGLGDIGPARGDAGDGGQVLPVQGVRERRRLPDLPGHAPTPTRSSATVKLIAPAFGGINLEDISAPRCFEIEEQLKAKLDIPVFHDDQHGTAVVVLAALLNAVKLTGRTPGGPERPRHRARGGRHRRHARSCSRRASATSSARTRAACCTCEREDYLDGSMSPIKRWFAESTNPDCRRGAPADVIDGHGPAHRRLRREGAARRVPRAHEPRRDGLRDGEPEPGGRPRGGRALRPDHGDGPLGLPEPDQQRALLPGHLPRRPGRPGAVDHRGHEDGGRPRDRGRSSTRRTCARTTSSRRSSTATSPRRWPPPSPSRRGRPASRSPTARSASPPATPARTPRSRSRRRARGLTVSADLSPLRITITGATGLIGPQLVRAAAASAATRSPCSRATPSGRARLLGDVEAVAWDLMSEPAPAGSAQRQGRGRAPRRRARRPALVARPPSRRSARRRVIGTGNLIDGLRAAEQRPSVLVSSSAIGYYGAHGLEPLDEDAPRGRRLPGAGLRRVGAAGGAAPPSSACGWCRSAPASCSTRDGGALAKMLPPFRMGVGGPVAGGRQFISWIHTDDLVGIMLAAIDDERWSGPVNATAPEPLSNRDFSRVLGRVLHRPAVLPVPGSGAEGRSTATWRRSSPPGRACCPRRRSCSATRSRSPTSSRRCAPRIGS